VRSKDYQLSCAESQGMAEVMTSKKKREKVVAEITASHLIKLMEEQGQFLNPQQACAFLNEGDRAYMLWKQMMQAGESYIKSELARLSPPVLRDQNPVPSPKRETWGLRTARYLASFTSLIKGKTV